MSGLVILRSVAVAATLALLGGCAYDYMQRSDKVAYSSGDAVKANLERQTINPTKGSSYSTKGLGKNGSVIETQTNTTTATTPTP